MAAPAPPSHPPPLRTVPMAPRSASNVVQGTSSKAKWTPALTKRLVELLLEYNTPLFRRQNGWTMEGWNKIVDALNISFPRSKLIIQQVKDRESELKKDFEAVKKLREVSGMEWNNATYMLETSEEVWNALIVVNHQVVKWQQTPFPYYDDLCLVYEEGNIVEGHGMFTSPGNESMGAKEEVPLSPVDNLPNSFVDRANLKNPNLNDLVMDIPVTQTRHSYTTASSRHSQTRLGASPFVRLRKKHKSGYDRIADVIESYLTWKIDEINRREMKEQENPVSKYSVSKCVLVLNEIQELTITQFVKATKLFKDPYNREVFLSLKPGFQVAWLLKNIEE